MMVVDHEEWFEQSAWCKLANIIVEVSRDAPSFGRNGNVLSKMDHGDLRKVDIREQTNLIFKIMDEVLHED